MPHNADTGLIGRDRELAVLTVWLDQAVAGRGRMVLIGGAPGIGKSRLSTELAEVARQRDLLVLSGRGWADVGARPYWPWVQVLRTHVRATSAEEARAVAGPMAQELAHVLPEIGVPPAAQAPDEDPNAARFRLFDAVTTFLRDVADRRPVVVLLEDLHAADTPSLLLLRFLASQLADARMLVIGTYRDLELAPADARAIAIEQLARDPNAVALPLAGLHAADAARLVASTIGSSPDAGVLRALWRETQGNPLFLAHAARLLEAEGRLAGAGPVEGVARVIPEVRDVILRRAEQLSPDAVRVLSHAAVLGPEFDAEMLGRLVDLPAAEVLRHLEEAIDAGLVADMSGSPGRYRFVHDLIRESLGDILPAAERVGLHRRIVETIEAVHGDDLRPHASALAYHALEAARGEPTDQSAEDRDVMAQRAVRYAREAGDEAMRSFAWEEAARLYGAGITVADRARVLDDRLRFGLLLSQGEAESRGGNVEAARDVFAQAVEVGRRMGSARDVAIAVIGYGGRLVWHRAGDDPRLVPLLREALDMLGREDDSLRARLLVRLACALRGQPGANEESDALSGEAVALARGLGDDLTLTYVLGGRAWAIWWPDNTAERIGIGQEMLEVARRADDSERIVDAHTMLCLSFLELGQVVRARAAIAEIDRVAGTIRQPVQRWLGMGQRAAVELAVGNFAEAEQL
ncbi:MAG: AAA family ATPase, partial [Chloroflexota bacterium]|nr:AAA family ATPase [Chloroflexota bacterium]